MCEIFSSNESFRTVSNNFDIGEQYKQLNVTFTQHFVKFILVYCHSYRRQKDRNCCNITVGWKIITTTSSEPVIIYIVVNHITVEGAREFLNSCNSL